MLSQMGGEMMMGGAVVGGGPVGVAATGAPPRMSANAPGAHYVPGYPMTYPVQQAPFYPSC